MDRDAIIAAMMFGGSGGGLPDASEASVGDVLTKGEGGIGWSAPSGGGGVLRVGLNETTLDKTWQEISDCFSNGGYAYVADTSVSSSVFIQSIFAVGYENGGYYVTTFDQGNVSPYVSATPDGYPAFVGGGGIS